MALLWPAWMAEPWAPRSPMSHKGAPARFIGLASDWRQVSPLGLRRPSRRHLRGAGSLASARFAASQAGRASAFSCRRHFARPRAFQPTQREARRPPSSLAFARCSKETEEKL